MAGGRGRHAEAAARRLRGRGGGRQPRAQLRVRRLRLARRRDRRALHVHGGGRVPAERARARGRPRRGRPALLVAEARPPAAAGDRRRPPRAARVRQARSEGDRGPGAALPRPRMLGRSAIRRRATAVGAHQRHVVVQRGSFQRFSASARSTGAGAPRRRRRRPDGRKTRSPHDRRLRRTQSHPVLVVHHDGSDEGRTRQPRTGSSVRSPARRFQRRTQLAVRGRIASRETARHGDDVLRRRPRLYSHEKSVVAAVEGPARATRGRQSAERAQSRVQGRPQLTSDDRGHGRDHPRHAPQHSAPERRGPDRRPEPEEETSPETDHNQAGVAGRVGARADADGARRHMRRRRGLRVRRQQRVRVGLLERSPESRFGISEGPGHPEDVVSPSQNIAVDAQGPAERRRFVLEHGEVEIYRIPNPGGQRHARRAPAAHTRKHFRVAQQHVRQLGRVADQERSRNRQEPADQGRRGSGGDGSGDPLSSDLAKFAPAHDSVVENLVGRVSHLDGKDRLHQHNGRRTGDDNSGHRHSDHETDHRFQPSQRNHNQSRVGHPLAAVETLQTESRLPIRIHVSAFGLRQLYSARTQILQPVHHFVCESKERDSHN